ncbi:MAG: lysophospholipid acyltransferase family protein [Alphaproteobacteria bacterium]|nr:lysophospholipid acyltransferase family protein [Alphaproteobacteria bacterium]
MNTLDEIAALLNGILRLAGFFLLLLVLIPTTILFKRIYPSKPFLIPRIFHRLLLNTLGIRVIVSGEKPVSSPALFVSNHASYLDIPVLGSLLSAGFVAKADVAEWPLFGLLARLQNTIFIERRAARAAAQSALLQEYLAKKRSLILFPEGTSSEGLTALPFKSSLFSIVEDSSGSFPLIVQPVSVTCVELNGFPILREDRGLYAWFGDMTMVPHLWNVFKYGRFTVDVVFHPPLTANDYPNRKDLAAACHERVTEGIKRSLGYDRSK